MSVIYIFPKTYKDVDNPGAQCILHSKRDPD